MNRIRSVAALLVFLACGGEFTGLSSVDLRIESITFRDSCPATITGILLAGKPARFIEEAQSPLILSMTVECAAASDTQGMAEVNRNLTYPLFYSVTDERSETGTAHFNVDIAGLDWEPEYSIIRENNLNRVYAVMVLENMTIETWQADTLRFIDPDFNQVTSATGRITVRQGSSVIPWWEAPAGNELQILRYGWPCPGRWNALTAVYCPGGGRVASWPGHVWESGDTLYFAADSMIELDLDFEQFPREYRCFLSVESIADKEVTWQIQWPERLPRGAIIEPGPQVLNLSPSESATIIYKEVY